MRVRGRDKRRFRVVKGGRQDLSRFWPEAKRQWKWSNYSGLWGFSILAGSLVGVGWATLDKGPSLAEAEPQALLDSLGARVDFGFCHTGGGTNCVVDGDTIWFHGQNIRVVGLDAPETHEPSCMAERALGERATRRLHQLVNGGVVSLSTIDRGQDRYGRKLRIVTVDGVSVAETLIDDGLARRYEGGPKRGWC